MSSVLVRAAACLVLFLLCLNMFATLQGSSSKFTFGRLLEIAGSFETEFLPSNRIDLNQLQIPRITADWGIANFLRDFINTLIAPLNVIFFILGAIVYVIAFIVYLLPYILL